MNSIDIFPWNENFNTGVPKIDQQHRKLVQLLNVLASHIAFESDLPALNIIFDELADYALHHFQTEATIWHRYLADDELETRHKATHDSFIDTVLKIKAKQSSQPANAVLEQVLAFLTRWLAAHILESDRHMAMIVLGMQSGMTLESAKKLAAEKMSGTTPVLIDLILSIYENLSSNALQLMRELSQRKRDEESLLKLSLAVEQSPSSIVITNRDATIEFVNEAFLNATGYDRGEAIGQNPRLLQSGKTPQETFERMWAALTQGRVWEGEFINRRKDGSEYVELAQISPIHQADGSVSHYLAIKEDITERKRLERDLVDQLAFTQAVINAEVNGIAVFHQIDEEPHVRFTVWNPSMRAITGFSLEEMNRLGWYRTIYTDPAIQQQARLCMRRLQQGDPIQDQEWAITRKHGERRIVQIHATGCADDAQGAHILVVMHDITQRKQAEKALLESHQQMDSLLNSMAEGVYGVDTEGVCGFVNRSFLQILGYENTEQIIGKPIHDLIHHSHPDGSHFPAEQCKIHDTCLHHQEIHLTDEVFWRSDGVGIPVEYRAQPIVTNGVMTGAIATFVDISDRKKAEEAAQSAAQYARSLIEASLDPLVTISAAGKITDVNTATEWVTGVGREKLIGSDFADYFTDPADARAGYQLVFSQGFVTDFPLTIRHASGKITEVLYNASVYRDGNGTVLGVLATARNITERKRIEARLSDSESHLRTIIENEPECIKIVDAQGRLVQMNPAGLAMIEADGLEQVLAQPVLNVIAPEYRKAFADMHARVIAGQSAQLEYEVIGLKGGRRWLETHAVPMKEADGTVVHLAVTRDISERKRAEDQLRIAATVFESQEGMMVTDANNVILRVNQAFTEITGYPAAEVVGKNPHILQSGRQDKSFYAAMWESIATSGTWEGEIWNRRKNGEVYPEYLTIKAVTDQCRRVTHYVGTLSDISLRKSAAEEIERLAFYDPLTGLPNRRLLQNRLKPALANSHHTGRNGALLFIDLDNFKSLNDTLGHDMGDLLLQQVSDRLNTCVRESDTVARLGGDEFVVMLENLSEDLLTAAQQTEAIGEKIIAAINRPFSLATHDYISTPSIGATLFKGQQRSADDLLKHADIAMYQAKISGRNALRFFDPKMQEAVIARVSLENELRKALDNRQFQLFYQIQVENSDRVFGAEALIRWLHPERGLVSPADFIPLAEENGMILGIGLWLLETACARLKAWRQEPATRELVLSINISPKQFFQIDFVNQVQTALQKHAVDPSRLKLELTENILIENIDETIETMNALGAIGVQFSLDDFGTGYSSLQYLKKLPLNQLKIDQSFIRDIVEDSGDQAIVRTIIAMAASLNLGVIAEGVETEQQRRFLFDNNCKHYQGYLFSKPLPLEQFEQLLTLTKPRN
ncbi:bacteriohemerythrin [Methylomonas sp. LL1]|uniref:bacteriohemerythrin n=1 Tax=Methylomonas sp. LL1 TaxID=2785785 RepID=UPI0018C3BC44|nr:bacteriohemerythrin [Methylomonas sp. LL1]QPK64572.1 bacteriohemerythrin [Methylomonas sp. LL1]